MTEQHQHHESQPTPIFGFEDIYQERNWRIPPKKRETSLVLAERIKTVDDWVLGEVLKHPATLADLLDSNLNQKHPVTTEAARKFLNNLDGKHIVRSSTPTFAKLRLPTASIDHELHIARATFQAGSAQSYPLPDSETYIPGIKAPAKDEPRALLEPVGVVTFPITVYPVFGVREYEPVELQAVVSSGVSISWMQYGNRWELKSHSVGTAAITTPPDARDQLKLIAGKVDDSVRLAHWLKAHALANPFQGGAPGLGKNS